MSYYGPSSATQPWPAQPPSTGAGMSSRKAPSAPGIPPHPQLPSRDRGSEGYSTSGPTLPPPRPSSQASTESDRRSSRTFASVQSILNPSGDDHEPRGRRRSAAQMEEESQISPTMPNIPPNRPPSSGDPNSEKSPPSFQGSRSGMPRRILTPISPTLHRTTSVSRIVPGTIDAQSTPFLANASDSRSHSIEPSSAGFPPTLPPFSGSSSQRQSFSYSAAPTPPLQAVPRRKSVSVLPSARVSPSPSYSSYSRSGQVSPSLPYPPSTGPTPSGPLSLVGSPLVGPLSSIPPVSLDSEGPHAIPVVSAGQSTYEYFTIPSGRGFVSLPVEVHVASRQADEKRKRNAGASARFRQRRKEKEREANSTIDRLKEQLRAVTEDCEYYKTERDRFFNALKETPGWERYLPRSPSPRLKRRALSSHTISTSGVTSGGASPTSPLPPPAVEMHSQPGNESERNTRRRIDSDSYHSSGPQQEQAPKPPYPAPFPPFSPASGPHGVHTHPQHNGGVPGQAAPSHTMPIDSKQPGNSGYERPWPPQSMTAGRS
jgi:hypothetical protein